MQSLGLNYIIFGKYCSEKILLFVLYQIMLHKRILRLLNFKKVASHEYLW